MNGETIIVIVPIVLLVVFAILSQWGNEERWTEYKIPVIVLTQSQMLMYGKSLVEIQEDMRQEIIGMLIIPANYWSDLDETTPR